ncbi:type III PLP-dependent enzyme [Streptomyces sp. NPDC059568]|uniref:type III PLP-dependent enzyme n=1 Tax=Streptomyces sp. NPDC059568 TaxID=3346868 RepID=UPI0036D176AC
MTEHQPTTPAPELALVPGLDQVETPAYVYDLDEARRAHGLLRRMLPQPSRLFYSLKANAHPAIVEALAGLGCSAEVCSSGELAAALEAGVAPDRILYTGPGKRDAEMTEAVKAGVGWFSVDSPAALDQAARTAEAAGVTVRCLLRINDSSPAPGQSLTMTGVASQFGADADWVLSRPGEFAARPGVELAGLHLYMGSNITDEDALVAQFTTAVSTARRITDSLGLDLRLLNLGGGFGAPYARSGPLPLFDGLARRVAGLLDAEFPGWREGGPCVAFESGRFLSGSCGSLLTRVLDVKMSHGRPVVVLESGINHLGGMSGLRRLPPLVPEVRTAVARGHGGGVLRGAIVTGPLCTPLDTWARSLDLPEVRIGDVVEVRNVGAYGLSASLLAFLGHPMPQEVVVDGGRITGISRLDLVRRNSVRLNSGGKE